MNIESKEHLIAHIEGLQATLAKRNEKIAELENRLMNQMNDTEIKRIYDKGYREGWKACAGRLMESTRAVALSLRSIRKDAFDLYLYLDEAIDASTVSRSNAKTNTEVKE